MTISPSAPDGAPTIKPVFNITNPSDKYTIQGEPVACAVAVLLLGSGQYGLDGSGAEGVNPMCLMFGGEAELADWCARVLGSHLTEWVEAHRDELAEVLDSVLIGNRVLYEELVGSLPDGLDLMQFRAVWHDRNRTSMNDIGAKAQAIRSELLGVSGSDPS